MYILTPPLIIPTNLSLSQFFPFGAGPKGCVGQYLGLAEMKAALSEILGRFHFQTQQQAKKIKARWDIANQPTEPVYVRLLPRLHIQIIGPSSVGKTTLCHALQRYFTCNNYPQTSVPLIEEVGRRVFLEAVGEEGSYRFLRDPAWVVELQHRIWERQIDEEERHCDEFALVDRSAIDPFFYAIRYGKMDLASFERTITETPQGSERWKDTLQRYRDQRQTLLVLILPLDNCTRREDGVRLLADSFEDWKAEGELYHELILHFGVPHIILDCLDTTERVNKVLHELHLRTTNVTRMNGNTG